MADNAKSTSTDRIFVLEQMEGKSPLSTKGLVDARLFTGENNLHAIMDPSSCMWILRYDAGLVEQPLRQKFTSFKMLRKFVEDYYKRRNIQVKEILNAQTS